MEDDMRHAERYRRRALEIQAMAETMRDPRCRSVLLRVAESYERMAGSLERLAAVEARDAAAVRRRQAFAPMRSALHGDEGSVTS